ncbi:MAG: DNA integrity scanning diadenylate cyclase DisA [Clostridiales bacterium]
MKKHYSKNVDLIEILKIVAPGTCLREGLDNILKAGTGAIIVIGDDLEILDGGFYINKDYTASQLYELAKMDGAIILSSDRKKILYAGAQLIPDSKILSLETGTRHRNAERVAKQTKKLVICISQRRNIITLYKEDFKYILKDPSTIINKANQALQILDRYKSVLETAKNNLSLLEFEDIVTLYDVSYVIQRTEMVMRIAKEIEKYIYELGNEGRLISMQLDELTSNIESDGLFVIEDYMESTLDKTSLEILKDIKKLSNEDLMNIEAIFNKLGYKNLKNYETHISPKGYRIISKIPRVPITVVNNLVNEFNDFQGILKATMSQLDDVDGIGTIRARSIIQGLKRAQEQLIVDNKQNLR